MKEAPDLKQRIELQRQLDAATSEISTLRKRVRELESTGCVALLHRQYQRTGVFLRRLLRGACCTCSTSAGREGTDPLQEGVVLVDGMDVMAEAPAASESTWCEPRPVDGAGPHGGDSAWGVAGWVRSLHLSDTVAEALREPEAQAK